MASLPAGLVAKAREVMETCNAARLSVATAESCTGGLVAAALTAVPGSSTFVERGFVTYSNQAKTDMLGVPAGLIERVGAVSEEVARAMAEGAVAHSQAQAAVAVTGIAGPTGGSLEKPVGTVHLAAAVHGKPTRHRKILCSGDRDAVREASAVAALVLLIEAITG